MSTKPEPTPDPYEGVGGSYVIDQATGRRVQVVAPPDSPQTARPAAIMPIAATAAASVDTSALAQRAADKDYSS
jgi:hypothetical protein